MALRPPQHRIDAPICYVHPKDTAWDHERIERERVEMKKAGLDPDDHPVARYGGGFTRYDLDAEATLFGQTVTVRAYLDEAKQPTIWRLKRLGVHDWYDVEPLWQKGRREGEEIPTRASVYAASIGVIKVENGPVLELTSGRLTTNDLERIREIGSAIGSDLIVSIGVAVYQGSMPLREDERRPFV